MTVYTITEEEKIKASIACDVCDTGNADVYVTSPPSVLGSDLLHASCTTCMKKGAIPSYIVDSWIVEAREGTFFYFLVGQPLQTFAKGEYVSLNNYFDEVTKAWSCSTETLDKIRQCLPINP